MAAQPPHRRLSLRAKWTLALLVIGAVPLGALALLTLHIQKRGLIAAEHDFEAATIAHVGDLVDQMLAEASEATHRVGGILTEGRITEDEVRLELAAETMARADALAEVAIYGDDGAFIDAVRRKGAPDTPRPARLAVDKLAVGGAWLQPEYGGGQALLRYAEPMVGGGQRRGWVLGTMAPGALGRALEEMSKNQFEGRPDGVLLLDGEGRVLGGGGGTFAPGAPLAGADIFTNVHPPAGAFLQPFAVATDWRAGEVEMTGGVYSLPSHGWAAAVRRPAAEVFRALGDARRALAATTVAVAVAALALGALLGARATRPIRSLVELTRAYARREFARRSEVRTGDELEELGASMTDMADQLQAGEKEIARRAAVEADLSRYLPGEVARSIAAGEARLQLGGERRQVTVLFADVVAFTTFAEGAPPEQVVALLNELFTVLTEVVFRHGGTVDKFIGDCVMALFGAPKPQEDHAQRALGCAEDMHRFVEANAPAWKDKYGVELRLGIGVNSGEVLVGNLGSETRMEYTAIGDVVNVAARLEGLARPGQTLVTADTAQAAGDEFALHSLGEHPVRGKQRPVQIFELPQ